MANASTIHKTNYDLRTYKLRALLKKKDNVLYNKYDVFWNKARQALKFINDENYTDHGEDHVLRIEKMIFTLLTDKSKENLSAIDLFCLLCACCLHDLGNINKINSFENFSEIRADHHERTGEYLKDNYQKLSLEKHEAIVIGTICHAHGLAHGELLNLEEKSIDPYGKINTPFISTLLRLGDLLDLSFLRAPEIVMDLKKITGISLQHWNLHNKISDIQNNHSSNQIEIYAAINNEYELCDLNKIRNYIQIEIDNCSQIFKDNGIFLNEVIIKSNLDKKRVLTIENPFLKLDSFDWEKHSAFFGRDKEIIDVSEKVTNNKITILVGESGVGKTSLLNAGVKNKLIEDGLYLFPIRFVANFQEDLFNNLKLLFKGFSKFNEKNNLFDLLKAVSSNGFKIIIFFDQFEEIFTYKDESLKQEVILFYKTILSNKDINLNSVLIIREEFLADLWELSGIFPEFYNKDFTYRLKKLSRENAKKAVKNTIKHVGYLTDNYIIDNLLDDFTKEDETIYPPYLQIVCHRVFENHRTKYGNTAAATPINTYDYFDLGGADKIISDYFDEILDGFSQNEREVINKILSHMITFFQTKQRVSYEDISKINNGIINIDKTLDRLINHRIIRNIESENAREYELIHDFLARQIMETSSDFFVSSRVRQVKEHIDNNLAKPLRLKEVADMIGFSNEHLSRLFKKEMGINFVEYVNKERVNIAKKLLKDKYTRISAIYPKVGFSNGQHFSRIFKEYTGKSPSRFRKDLNADNIY